MRAERALGRFRRRVANGYGRTSSHLSFNHDGFEVARVKTRTKYLPLWHVVFFVYLALLIRLVVAADIGTSGYEARMTEMRNGTTLERIVARVMQMDPVSQEIATRVRAGLYQINESILDRRL